MATRFEKAPARLVRELADLMEAFHPALSDAEVSVDLLLAFGPRDEDGNILGEAIKVHGLPAAGCVRVVNLRDRTKGMGDAEIQIDGDHWDEWSERQIKSLLDHELTHLELQLDKKSGEVKRDDLDRPKLSLRPHDRQFGWFDSVARRWGADSWEAMQAKGIVEDWEFVQLYLPGFDPMDMGRVKPEFEAEVSYAG